MLACSCHLLFDVNDFALLLQTNHRIISTVFYHLGPKGF